MVIPDFSVSLITAVLLTGIYMLAAREAGGRAGLIWLFLIVFLATWAGGAWLRPFGPTLYGIHWLAFLLVGVVMVLLLFILIPPRAPRGRRETLDMLDRMERKKELEEVAYITLGVFFWILLALLLAAIILRYTIGLNI